MQPPPLPAPSKPRHSERESWTHWRAALPISWEPPLCIQFPWVFTCFVCGSGGCADVNSSLDIIIFPLELGSLVPQILFRKTRMSRTYRPVLFSRSNEVHGILGDQQIFVVIIIIGGGGGGGILIYMASLPTLDAFTDPLHQESEGGRS